MSISFIHLRFRKAYLDQGFQVKDLPFISFGYPYSNYLSFLLGLFIFIGHGYAVSKDENASMLYILSSYIGLFLFIACYFGYKWLKKTRIVELKDCDFSLL